MKKRRTRRRGQGDGDRGGVGPSSAGGPVPGAAGQGHPGEPREAGQRSDAAPPPFNKESTGAGSSSVSPSSPSKNANAEVGYSRVNYRLRSVLFHPLGLPLVSFFDDDPALREYVRESFPQVHKLLPYKSNKFDGVLRKSYQGFAKRVKEYDQAEKKKKRSGKPKLTKPSEESLTKATHEQIESKLEKSLEAKHQHSMYYHVSTKSKARTDILIKRNDDSDSTAIVLLLEVALGKKPEWWLKADQNVSYLKNFLKDMNKDSKAKFTGPVLFAVLTMRTTNGLDDVTFRSAHLGVFLCAPATVSTTCPDFRMALIWREMFNSLPDASKGMGKTLRAASALARIMANQDSMGFQTFQYLGPNCCRIKDKVRKAAECTNRFARIR
jgi:hypothetical protein